MYEAFVNVLDVPTHVFTWGNWIEESFSKKEIVLCITGNPGLAGYYTLFMRTVHEKLGRDIPVWVIGHAGHDEPKNSTRNVPPVDGNEHLFGLDAQVRHKIEFIRRYVPADVKIHLIGHSIGAWIGLELLKVDDISARIHQCYFLFPTIERMAESPNGRLYIGMLQRFWWLVYMAAVLFAMCPTILHVLLLRLYFYIWSIPKHCIGTTLKYIRPTILTKIILMADQEMIRVREVDLDNVVRNKHRIKFYYGATDGWTPLDYQKQLKERIPDVDASVDEDQINHAFVLRSSIEMGNKVAEWISKKRVNF